MLITAYKKRSGEWDITMRQASGALVVISSGDQVRVKIARNGQSPILDIDSAADTSNGSGCTAANPTRLNIDQDDLNLAPGVYAIEVSVVDDSDEDRIKHAESGIFVLHDTPTGDVGLT